MKETMAVSELIAKLAEFPPDYAVYTEGCDCHGEVSGVEDQGDKSVLITRGSR